MEHELGTLACVEAGFRADGGDRDRADVAPAAADDLAGRGRASGSRIAVEGKSTHCGNRPLAIRPGGPGRRDRRQRAREGREDRPCPPGARARSGG